MGASSGRHVLSLHSVVGSVI